MITKILEKGQKYIKIKNTQIKQTFHPIIQVPTIQNDQ